MLALNNDLGWGESMTGGMNAAPDLNHFALCPKQSPLNCGQHAALALLPLTAQCKL